MDDGHDSTWWRGAAAVSAFATLPYLELIATNLGEELAYGRVVVYWLVTMLFGAGSVLLLSRIRPSAATRVGVVVAVFLALFFNFPVTARGMDVLGIPERWHVAGWATLTVLLCLAALVAARKRWAATYAALVGGGLLLAPALQIATGLPAAMHEEQAHEEDAEDAGVDTFRRRPNIYFFLVDGYARADVVADLTGVDVGPFVEWLGDHGFEVSDDALANYSTTFLSVASTLEMEYLADETEPIARGPSYYRYIRGENATVETLKDAGYRYVHAFPGLFQNSRCSGIEDLCIGRSEELLSETDLALLAVTPLWPHVPDADRNALMARNVDPRYVTAQVLSSEVADEPHFVFAHLLNPHPPYLRTADCELRDVEWDLNNWGKGRTVADYGNAIRCLNRQLTEAVEKILAESPDAIIIIQGDHGHGPSSNWDGMTLEDRRARDRMAIMSALRLPADCDATVPEDLSPVNTVRLVMACLRGEPANLLPNRHYGVGYSKPDLVRLDTAGA